MIPQKKINLLNGQQIVSRLLKNSKDALPVFIMPDQTKPFQIECDASKYTSGAVLTQTDGNGNQKHFQKLKETTKYMTGNYWPSYVHSKNGDIIFKDHLTLPWFYLTIKIWLTIEKHENSIKDKLDGLFTYQNLTSSLSILQDI